MISSGAFADMTNACYQVTPSILAMEMDHTDISSVFAGTPLCKRTALPSAAPTLRGSNKHPAAKQSNSNRMLR